MTYRSVLLFFLCVPLSAFGVDPALVKAGFLLELSGKVSSLAAPCREGVALATEVVTRRNPQLAEKFQLIYSDTQDDTKVAVSEFKKLVEIDKVSATLVSRSKTALPLNPLSAAAQVPLLALSMHPQLIKGNPYAIRIAPTAEAEGRLLGDAILESGVKRLAIVTAEDEWNLAFSEAVKSRVESKGIKVTSNQVLGGDINDLTPVALRIQREKADGVFVNTILTQAGEFIRKTSELRMKLKLYSNHWVQYPEVLSIAGKDAMEGLVFVEVNYELPGFLGEFQAKYSDKRPNSIHYYCYLGAGMLLETASELGSNLNDGNFRKALLDKKTLNLGDVIPVIDREVQVTSRVRVFHDGVPTSWPH